MCRRRQSMIPTLSLVKFKQILGISEMEEEDFKIEQKLEFDPIDEEDQDSLLEGMPSPFARNFKEAIKPNTSFQKTKMDIPEIDDFTNKLFEWIANDSKEKSREGEGAEPVKLSFRNSPNTSRKLDRSPTFRAKMQSIDLIHPATVIHTGPANDEEKKEGDEAAKAVEKKKKAMTMLSRRNSIVAPLFKNFNLPGEGNNGVLDLSTLMKEEITEPVEEDKFVLSDVAEINLTSEKDVLSPSVTRPLRDIDPSAIISGIQPYKLKVKYAPTELPVEESEEGTVPTLHTQKSVTSMRPRRIHTSGSVTGLHAKKAAAHRSVEEDKKSVHSTFERKQADIEKQDISKSLQENDTRSEYSNVVQSIDPSSKKQKSEEPAKEDISLPELLEKVKADLEPEKKPLIPWSGQQVLFNSDPNYAIWATNNLNEIRLWKKGPKGLLEKIRHYVKVFVMSEITGGVMTLCVVINTIVLAMNRYGQSQDEINILQVFNTVFTSLFIIEMALKLFSLGIVNYLSDAMNYVDGIVVILSIVELVFLGSSESGSVFHAFQAFRILRTLRVVRMVRLLRVLHSMKLLIKVIGDTMTSFTYIGMLLIIFLFIYSLLGMQLFGGKFNFDDGKPRQNFDSFHNAFLSVYQILTIENWQSLQYYSMRAQVPALVALFYVTWLFIGNYVLLNLFLALMLDAFAGFEDEETKDTDTTVLFIMKAINK